MIGIPLGLATAGAVEWTFHKYIQHGLGKDKKNFWSFHLYEHHKSVKEHQYYDPGYHRFPIGLHAQGKEILGLLGASLLVSPLYPIAPFYVATLHYSALRYYQVHKKSHLDPPWGRTHCPCHYDHHMGPHGNANYCILHPWFDVLMGTRRSYAGTEQERQDLARTPTPEKLLGRME